MIEGVKNLANRELDDNTTSLILAIPLAISMQVANNLIIGQSADILELIVDTFIWFVILSVIFKIYRKFKPKKKEQKII